MSKPSSRHERRGPDRPSVADWSQCSVCADGMMVFTEHFRGSKSRDGSDDPIPAWVCDHCSNVVFVRADHQPAAVRRKASEARTKARRSLMKARFVRGRAERALHKSFEKKRRRS